jgi:hypothetical protein
MINSAHRRHAIQPQVQLPIVQFAIIVIVVPYTRTSIANFHGNSGSADCQDRDVLVLAFLEFGWYM